MNTQSEKEDVTESEDRYGEKNICGIGIERYCDHFFKEIAPICRFSEGYKSPDCVARKVSD